MILIMVIIYNDSVVMVIVNEYTNQATNASASQESSQPIIQLTQHLLSSFTGHRDYAFVGMNSIKKHQIPMGNLILLAGIP